MHKKVTIYAKYNDAKMCYSTSACVQGIRSSRECVLEIFLFAKAAFYMSRTTIEIRKRRSIFKLTFVHHGQNKVTHGSILLRHSIRQEPFFKKFETKINIPFYFLITEVNSFFVRICIDIDIDVHIKNISLFLFKSNTILFC